MFCFQGDTVLAQDQDTNDATIALSIADRPLSDVIQHVEKSYLCAVLNAAGGNKAKAARMAGLTYRTFARKVASLNLRVIYHER